MAGQSCGPSHGRTGRHPARVKAVFEIVTPMFLGGAVPGETPEPRPGSVKGALRFWWRALAWGRHWNELRSDARANADGSGPAPHEVLQAIWKEEACLFGTSAAGEARGDDASLGQARFLLRVEWEGPDPKPLKKHHPLKPGAGACYLGYGAINFKGELTRPAIPAGEKFRVELIARKSRRGEPAAIDCTLIEALKLLGLMGGLGARTRRGWGSLRLVSLRCEQGMAAEKAGAAPQARCGCDLCAWKPPETPDAYLDAIRAILGGSGASADGTRNGLPPDAPPYSAFAQGTRVVVAELSTADALSALNYVGEQMRRYRGWRPPGEKRFKDDHDWFISIPGDGSIRRDLPRGHPRRVAFGLPHNYFGRDHEPQKAGVLGEVHDRRASPLFIHIGTSSNQGKSGDNGEAGPKYLVILTVFPSQFLPIGERLWIWRRTPNRPQHVAQETLRRVNIDWNVLNGFIDGVRKEGSKFYFPNKKELWPADRGGAG